MKTSALVTLLLAITLAGCSKQPRQTVRNAGKTVRSAAQTVENKAALALHSATGPRQAGTIADAQKPSAAITAKSHHRRHR